MKLCESCERNPVMGKGDKFCDECYEIECSICKEQYSHNDFGDQCRHIQHINDDCEWVGCGCFIKQLHEDIIKKSLFELFKIAPDIIVPLKKGLKKHDFNFQYTGDCLGLDTRINVNLPGHYDWDYLTNALINNRKSEDESVNLQTYGKGFLWLMSLQGDGTTKRYDNLTIKWINEFQKNKL